MSPIPLFIDGRASVDVVDFLADISISAPKSLKNGKLDGSSCGKKLNDGAPIPISNSGAESEVSVICEKMSATDYDYRLNLQRENIRQARSTDPDRSRGVRRSTSGSSTRSDAGDRPPRRSRRRQSGQTVEGDKPPRVRRTKSSDGLQGMRNIGQDEKPRRVRRTKSNEELEMFTRRGVNRHRSNSSKGSDDGNMENWLGDMEKFVKSVKHSGMTKKELLPHMKKSGKTKQKPSI